MARTLRLAAVAVFVVVAVPRLSVAGANRWTTHGPFALSVTAMVADPSGAAVYAATASGGVLKSVDAGDHWLAVNQGLLSSRISALALRADAPSTLYAGTPDGQIFKTSNGGVDWTFLLNVTDNITALEFDPAAHLLWVGTQHGWFSSSDEGAHLTGHGGYPVIFIKVSNGLLYVGTSGPLFVSSDLGSTYQNPLGGAGCSAIALGPNPSTVYVATSNGVFRGTNSGQTWQALPPFDTNVGLPVTSLLAVDDHLYAATSAGVFNLNSTSWAMVGNALSGTAVSVLARESSPAGRVLAGTMRGIYTRNAVGSDWLLDNDAPTSGVLTRDVAVTPTHGDTAYAATTSGIFKTTDRGDTWKLVQSEPGGAMHVQVSTTIPDTVYATSTTRILKSEDAGQTWRGVKSSFRTSAIVVAPSDAGTVYAALADGMAKTTDGGGSWSSVMAGLPTYYAFYNDFKSPAMAVDPADASVAYSSQWDKLYRTADGGHLWSVALDASNVGALAIDPRHTSTIYAALATTGVSRSIDGGSKWSSFSLNNEQVLSLAISPADSIVYAGTFSGHVYKSADGDQWTRLDDGLGSSPVFAISIDSSGTTLYAATGNGVYQFQLAAAEFIRLPDDALRVPRLIDQLTSSRDAGFVIPVAGAIVGANGTVFSTDVTLSNARNASQDVLVAWLGGGTYRATIPAASNAALFADSISQRLGVSGVASLAVFAIDANGDFDPGASIDGFARIWSRVPGKTETSQLVASVHPQQLQPHGRAGASGMRHDAGFRTNVGVVNLSRVTQQFSVSVSGERHSEQFTMSVPALTLLQVAVPDRDYGALTITFTAGNTQIPWTAYGSSVNNSTGEAVTSIAKSQ